MDRRARFRRCGHVTRLSFMPCRGGACRLRGERGPLESFRRAFFAVNVAPFSHLETSFAEPERPNAFYQFHGGTPAVSFHEFARRHSARGLCVFSLRNGACARCDTEDDQKLFLRYKSDHSRLRRLLTDRGRVATGSRSLNHKPSFPRASLTPFFLPVGSRLGLDVKGTLGLLQEQTHFF